ncbi:MULTISPECIES: hypothetical protein [Pseudoalteromonas]|uniref:hypothetical protein n=1 Tax=Pseudoalteromonas TaxID=53246 RepID=UPI000FFE85E9|nr:MULTISPECIES: hypothetical protein [Pseudoalteromonas]MCG9758809.1 hypothetical protein [Pseudoalteromonas sp. Isolate6]NKC18280.1 hypothetical protein [Pseudoalteromonas galatheae]RXE85213.1 hypothetical protein DRB05_15785 [Pseudoalteromonas sp. A757]
MSDLCGAKTTKVVHDLREFTCPALFVQFKWRLKRHDYTLGKLKLLMSQEQSLLDIKKYLDGNAISYQIIELKGEEVCLEIMDV